MKIALLLLIIPLSLMACKGKKMTPVEPPAVPVYESVVPEPVPVPEPPAAEEITVIEESFDFERKEDEVNHEINRFFVILGSFRVSENAARFKSSLASEGFDPVILLSETGFNRVCVSSHSDEAQARQRVIQIRRSYPRYSDAWLLIRK